MMIIMTDNHNQNKKSDEKQLLQHNTTRMLTIIVTDVGNQDFAIINGQEFVKQ